MNDTARPLLSLEGVVTTLRTSRGVFRAVDEVSFDVAEGSKVAIVGESGSGKTMTALSIMQLLPSPTASVQAGKILLRGRNLLQASEREMRKVRGNEVSMVFQEPLTSLNPVLTVGYQIAETLRAHRRVSRKAARARAVELLGNVGIASPSTRVDAYPHQLSGGMRQRVMLAVALSCEPSLLIADEPTTALDVTIEAEILDLLDRLRTDNGTATLLITHDLGVVAGFAERVVVMYAGQVVEVAPVGRLFRSPAHPYTQALLRSLPPAPDAKEKGLRRLPVIEGRVPELGAWPTGCRFQDRCDRVTDACRSTAPDLVVVQDDHQARCLLLKSGGEA